MKKRKQPTLLLVFGLGLGAILLLIFLLNHPAFQTDVQRQQTALDNVPRVSVAQAKRARDSGEALLVDVRSRFNHEMIHIPGSINVPLSAETPYTLDASTDTLIYLYCT